MSVEPNMFLFEVVMSKVIAYGNGRLFVIKAEFADVFALEMKDPKSMAIKIPDPLPLPPETGKKGKKKPKPKKKKKGKEPPPPPEPLIQVGQSILFASTPEFLLQNMKDYPLVVSVWNKEESLTLVGSVTIPWDPRYIRFLDDIYKCLDPPAIEISDDYNIFEEGTPKLLAKISMQLKLSCLKDKITATFRTLNEDETCRKFLYTGYNAKLTSFMCTLKPTDNTFDDAQKGILSKYIVDKPEISKRPVCFASFENAASPNMLNLEEDEICCKGNADKALEHTHKSPETIMTIEEIDDYVRRIIRSCNDNLRMLTPRPTIRPRIKATDMDRLCYCKETTWPSGEFATRFRREVQGGPCPICIDANRPKTGPGNVFDIANLRGPCGRPDCRIARDLRAYIQLLAEEDKEEIVLNDIVGPCGSKTCTVAEQIRDFLQHKGEFTEPRTLPGLSTQCACNEVMKDALAGPQECSSDCTINCQVTGSKESFCDGPACPHKPRSCSADGAKDRKPITQQVYNVYYFTVEYHFDKEINSDSDTPDTNKSTKSTRSAKSYNADDISCKDMDTKGSPTDTSYKSTVTGSGSKKLKINPKSEAALPYKYCSPYCPTADKYVDKISCSKNVCSSEMLKYKSSTICQLPTHEDEDTSPCFDPVCLKVNRDPPSPADSHVEIKLNDIHPACCIDSCDVAGQIKDLIVDGIEKQRRRAEVLKYNDPCQELDCYCDCSCNFGFTKRTTYCGVCGGYECLGDDMINEPEYRKPHPCPVYNNLYDKKLFKVKGPWSDDRVEYTIPKSKKTAKDTISNTSRKSMAVPLRPKESKERKSKKKKASKQKAEGGVVVHKCSFHGIVPVPRDMGWLWNEDIPGLKYRPKWRPGAVNKLLVRRYKAVREGMDIILKKKRAMMNKKKKLEMKPTVIVKKTDGEYTVQMEVFKKYSKERLLYQYPYEDKPPLMYTVGKTSEEKLRIQKHRDRQERRENRRRCKILQSTFRDRCQEICLKAYNAAIGLLPVPNPNAPECPCHTDAIPPVSPPMDSCSCSEEYSVSTDDTDGDDWIVEFTPPAARWDASAKHLPTYTNGESQYTYLDYKVKVLDKSGNQVPRFFKGPDGRQECSDLGGFWGQDHTWLEINKDGYIGPDKRWVPCSFIGPDGVPYSSDEGFFVDTAGKTYFIGIDGYVDQHNKWVHYPMSMRPKQPPKINGKQEKPTKTSKTKPKDGDMKTSFPLNKPSGAAQNTESRREIPGKKKPSGPTKPVTANVTNTPSKSKKPLIVSVSHVTPKRSKTPTRSTKGIGKEEAKRMSKYKEIMKSLEMYEEFGSQFSKYKTNRASNTTKKALGSNPNGDGLPKTNSRIILERSPHSSYTRTNSSIVRYQA